MKRFYGPLSLVAALFLAVFTLTKSVGIANASPPHVVAPPSVLPPSSFRETSEQFRAVANHVGPAVVSIRAERSSRAPKALSRDERRYRNSPNPSPFGGTDPFSEFFRNFEQREDTPESTQASSGSGIVIDKRGYILTNNHVVEGGTKFTVDLSEDGSLEVPATLVGTDRRTDLAVLKIAERKDLTVAEWGNSDSAQVGDWVVAIGSPFMLDHSVTQGIVSAKRRNSTNLMGPDYSYDIIQTDAAINPGNSGGPLCTLDGKVVGVNTAIFTQSGGGNIGIGFAIPSNLAQETATKLISDGKITRGRLGVYIGNPLAELKTQLGISGGARVLKIEPKSPASGSGIKPGDIILEVDSIPIKDATQLRRTISSASPGQKLAFKVLDDQSKKTRTVKVTLGKLDGDRAVPDGTKSDSSPDTLGLSLQEQEGGKGLVVESVRPGSIAALQGINPGDVILRVDHTPVSTLKGYEDETKSKESLTLLVDRNGEELFFEFSLPEK